MKYEHGFYFPKYETHFPKMLEKSMKQHGVNRYQWKVRDFATSLCKTKRIALDIGANIGLWSCDLVNNFDRVIAFEPVLDFRKCFISNVRSSNYILHDCALGNKESTIEMIITKDNSGHSHIDPASFGKGRIPLKTLDSFMLDNIDLIKIDCEGAETDILLGAELTIKSNKPVLIIEQQKHEYLDQSESLSSLKIVEAWGYKIVQGFNKDWVLVV